ncbi:uncharacterized protein LOC126743571 [Anthonomus grandis grandis]|uniref:uncharacterized protein LOC126743571 n=1 Tax=Anthonomus grandis grandis TaxID=2921223 RepID=UPI002166A015|nr:uncharacterized protein LOC126743571 [Anthonomus grandis grandis]
MGMFFPCLAAACANGAAIKIFREPTTTSNGPLFSLYIFIFTCFLLMWSVRIYPGNLRKVGKLQFIVEFLISDFLMQNLIIDFWFPLETLVMEGLPNLGQTIDDWVAVGDWNAEVITDLLKNESAGFYASYFMSTFFLIITLHACRIIDLRTLTQEGPMCFFKEIGRKIKLTIRRLIRKFVPGKRRVKINERRNTCRDYCAFGPQNPHVPDSKDYCSQQDHASRRRRRSSCSPAKRYCPVHNPMPPIDFSDCSETSTEDFRKSSC